jgi:tetratricopeptide (TPR) repeat protein
MAYHDRAVCLAHLRQNDRALADYNRALELASDNPLTWNGRGVIYLRRKEYQKAISDFTMAIQLRPKFVQPYENRAAAKKALGDIAGHDADLSLARGLKQ